MPKTPELKWVSCTKEVNPVVGTTRHLIPTQGGAVTTLCGSSGLGEGVWRGNTTKPECSTCMRIVRSNISSVTVEVPGGYNFIREESDSATNKNLKPAIARRDIVAIKGSSHHFVVMRTDEDGGFSATHTDDERIKIIVRANETDDIVIIRKWER